MLKRQMTAAFRMRDVTEVRYYLDSVAISSPALSEVNIREVVHRLGKVIDARVRGREKTEAVSAAEL
jgi:hypothetical protein